MLILPFIEEQAIFDDLVEVAEREGTRARLIESAEDISAAPGGDLDGAVTVGLTAGASTPEALVEQTISHLGSLGFARVEELRTAEEDIEFDTSRQLRQLSS